MKAPVPHESMLQQNRYALLVVLLKVTPVAANCISADTRWISGRCRCRCSHIDEIPAASSSSLRLRCRAADRRGGCGRRARCASILWPGRADTRRFVCCRATRSFRAALSRNCTRSTRVARLAVAAIVDPGVQERGEGVPPLVLHAVDRIVIYRAPFEEWIATGDEGPCAA